VLPYDFFHIVRERVLLSRIALMIKKEITVPSIPVHPIGRGSAIDRNQFGMVAVSLFCFRRMAFMLFIFILHIDFIRTGRKIGKVYESIVFRWDRVGWVLRIATGVNIVAVHGNAPHAFSHFWKPDGSQTACG